MAEGSVPLLLLIVALIILSGLFSMTETAYTGLNTVRVKILSDKNKRYNKVLNLYEDYDKLLSTILVGNNVVNILSSTLMLIFFQKNLIEGIDPALISTLVITIAVLLFGEIIPKGIGKAHPEKVAYFVYPFIICFFYLLYVINILVGFIQSLTKKIFKLDHEDVITDEELLSYVDEATEDGTLKEEESDLIKSAIEFDDLEVKDILIPRTNVVAVNKDCNKEEIKEIFNKERFSRVPVYSNNIDQIIGMIHEKDFYREYEKSSFELKDIIQEVIFVAEHTKISVLLKKLQARKIHMAVVLDEYGGTLGVCTLEDIIEELVGEIYDEYDEEDEKIKKVSTNSYNVSAMCELDDFIEFFDITIDDEIDANTVSGWVSTVLGDIPRVGKSFEYQGLKILVTKATKKRLIEIKVEKS